MLADTLRRAGFRIRRMTHANLLLLPLILAGRSYLRAAHKRVETENNLHPRWSNGVLKRIFSAERHLLGRTNLPLGVSILCVATRDGGAGPTPSTAARG